MNGESVIGKSQDEVVSTLRAVTIGSVVSITLSRQNEDLPRKLVSNFLLKSNCHLLPLDERNRDN